MCTPPSIFKFPEVFVIFELVPSCFSDKSFEFPKNILTASGTEILEVAVIVPVTERPSLQLTTPLELIFNLFSPAVVSWMFKSLPSTIIAKSLLLPSVKLILGLLFDIVKFPVNVPPARGSLVAIELVTVVAKFGSEPSASLSSFSVSKVLGAELTKLDIAVSV